MTHARRAAAPLALVLALAACSGSSSDDATGRGVTSSPAGAGDTATDVGPGPEPGAPTLRATLTTPTDIDLSWDGGAPGTSGYVLEFATEEDGEYTALQYLPPEVTEFRHPDLIPGTPFFYRLRAFDGPTSGPVEVDLPEGELTAEDENTDHAWLSPVTREDATVPGSPLATGEDAAPAALEAEVMHANGIHFTWTDRSADEAGFLLESRLPGEGSVFGPVALLEPDVNSYGIITLPEEKHASYRVRAFTYGPRSNTVLLTTGVTA
ncbi:fibronectin type III domain-containing protein [Streptomyces avicenniae]|uniref:fibronectin type III domain-containing protein n=1 Tax=Streptomyces avicenniae TaxID=500153 RepID=UPI000B196A35|nr:fibronectin type III domain-containing protein [Streptomyces avicenniae]